MYDSTTTKVCHRCGHQKPLSEFYVRSGYHSKTPSTDPGHYLSECKECYKERSRTYKRPPRGDSTVHSQQMAIDYLRQNGIATRNANQKTFPHADIVAWGCIPIEVKYAQLKMVKGNLRFAFVATPKQREHGFRADIVILICEYEPGVETYHIFDAQHPVFYINGQMKSGVTYTPDTYKVWEHSDRVCLTPGMMNAAEDALWLIENKRQEYSDKLKAEAK